MIRAATTADLPALVCLIRALADYEKLSHTVDLDEARLSSHLFGDRPAAEAIMAEHAGRSVGFALFFMNYSTFRARPGVYLEDLFVEPSSRGLGLGKALLAAVARIAIERNCARFEWSVLNWNTPAIGFYEKLGAKPLDDWTVYRLEGDALTTLARAGE